ncbi:MAG: MFS transporter [Chloroflexi bacterium]|nr:MAG: MFS transporter [Chloroflexota bacterium]
MNAATYRQLKRNESRVITLAFFRVFLVIIPIAVPFFQSRGLSMQEVFVLQALFSGVVLIMEVPSGYLADLIGRKHALVWGCAFIGLGHSFLLVADGFATLALFEISLGIGASLASGADLALLYETERALSPGEGKRQLAVSRLFSTQTLSEAVAGVACSLLLLASMQAVVYAQVLVGWIPIIVALGLVEPPGERLSRESHAANLSLIVRHLLRDDRLLRLIFLTYCVWSLTTFYAVWMLQKLWQQQGIDLLWFGYLWAGLTLSASISGRFAHQVEERIGSSMLLVLVGLGPVLGYLGLAWFGPVGGLVASVSFFVSRGFGLVVLKDALNRRVPGRFRATANSLASFGFRGSFVLTGPWVGYVLDAWGMQTTLLLLAGGSVVIFVTLVLPLLLAARSYRRKEQRREPQEHQRPPGSVEVDGLDGLDDAAANQRT